MVPIPDEAFRALANEERRQLLLALTEHNPPSVDTLEYLEDISEASQVAVEKLRVRLHHQHLPLLDRAGLIEWDRKTRQLRKGPNFDEIRPLLECLKTIVIA